MCSHESTSVPEKLSGYEPDQRELRKMSCFFTVFLFQASCKDLQVIEGLYIYLTTSDSTEKLIYVFMNGIMKNYNTEFLKTTTDVISKTQPKINFVQTHARPCGQSIDSGGPSLMWKLANMTGGQVHVISAANVRRMMALIPLEYQSSLIFHQSFSDCKNGQTISIPLDSQTYSATVLIKGEVSLPDYYWDIYNDYSSNSIVLQLGQYCSGDRWESGFGGKCYAALFLSLNWFRAKNFCSDIGGILVNSMDQLTQDFVISKIAILVFKT